ncbi:N-alpha-acetyltransferase 30 [Yamadazyma tenuis]|uniref:N-alpha-acetyltransferase 30 n=1 Tax=Candida tenuis (strain ATCC 10573 / BCRC 21748 / CBS 615 / JCM 9827 / NBRC 10315 / NRRL Y-1498 / VKM Y-70) TaxID=590646 RepID=G3BCB3_CANTC|nr:acyl-CoA N-acyltransferase [Yamadazyma tenuis ATCC 10573]EGV60157.1 acyl-CoA N-acyltransferase [Yamadazyma tenuis ATCC 10573]WEJ94603.1 N-alpha-acetyltransferase 30 [Yamadazyma tenuis]
MDSSGSFKDTDDYGLVATVGNLRYQRFNPASQNQFRIISNLIADHLSEPYSIYVYWYFLNTWPQYCYITKDSADTVVGVIISKINLHRNVRTRGYIGMLVIDPIYRKKGIAKKLVQLTIDAMIEADHVDEISLETEVINKGALRLYESLGFMRVKRLYKYYLSTHDAFRLILPVSDRAFKRIAFLDQLPEPVST